VAQADPQRLRYTFTNQKASRNIFGVFLVFDLFWAVQYAVYGSFVLIGGRLAFLPEPYEAVLLVVFFGVGTIFSGVATVFPSTIDFYDSYVLILSWHDRTKKQIPYSQFTGLTTRRNPAVIGLGKTNRKYYLQRGTAEYELPAKFRSAETADSFFDWLESKAPNLGRRDS
jgi:hypothetical protein